MLELLDHPQKKIENTPLQALITNKCHLRWHQKWLSYSTKLNQINHNTDNWTFPIETPKKFEVIITSLRIGHSQISHSFLMAKEDPPTCATCGVQITIKHILTECGTYLNIRSSLNLLEPLSEILQNHPKAITGIIQFITTANLQSKI